ncbi:RNA methyltransferase [Desulfohalovibrio reitneri]|uniref:RNA methyltransferase n=1 Tax=Desulfohalovibrio reitneri TaxID=1307759 RepID=UPI0004A70DE1|nr:RNA methyltransferase [Desulfohalovibrio reitneri]
MTSLDNLSLILVRPRFPENIGSVARACLNFGCPRLALVAPENFDQDKARPLATAHAAHILDAAEIHPDLESALAGVHTAVAATARTGGWRKGILPPGEAASEAAATMASGGGAALVLGPEDAGLSNGELMVCTHLTTIPTAMEGRSLNLAQAALLLLWECFQAARPASAAKEPGRLATVPEREALMRNIARSLRQLDVIKGGNDDYWLLPMRRFLTRFPLRRVEFDMLMGITRQVDWLAGRSGEK